MANPHPPLITYVLRQADRSMILMQRLLEYVTHAPELEEEVALSNIALDLLGQARLLYTYAGALEGEGHDEDHFAYWRNADAFLNPLLVEQPNGDFGQIIVRQFLHDAFSSAYWDELTSSTDTTLAAIASKAVKETAYHVRHTRRWVVRLGDGTAESHERAQSAVHALWRHTGELFERDEVEDAMVAAAVAPDPEVLRERWTTTVTETFHEATLVTPDSDHMTTGGRSGTHTEPFSYLLGEMQVLARAHPGATW